MYARSLRVSGFRCFESAELEFSSPTPENDSHENLNLILGDNGSGKTTLMRAICLAVLG